MTIAWILFGLGALLCLINFYLSFLRYPLHRLRGLSEESYQWMSSFPVFGSLFVALSLIGLHKVSGMVLTAIVLILIDTGGIHWFVILMLYQFIHDKKGS